MPSQVLARKFRPRAFPEIVGQRHVVQALVNALDQDRLHHAYLFTGTRGVGKTTIARIIAKCLNCEKGVSATPCGECGSCTEISEGRFVDLIEVDAASRTKVEDTRELLENVQYAPTRGKFKIYLIDEVHMLSGHSFNALLKTLEEPPPHVKFLLATTDPQKLPVTVLSRCLQFHLKSLSIKEISGHLEKVCAEEKVECESPAILQLARAADGSLRDSLSLLDQAIAFGGGKIINAEVSSMLGTIEPTHLFDLTAALQAKDADRLFEVIANISELSADFETVLEEWVSFFHAIAIAQAVPTISSETFSDQEKILSFAKSFSPEEIQLLYQIALIGRRDMPLAPSMKSGFEMLALRMLAFKPANVSIAPLLSEGNAVSSSGEGVASRVSAPAVALSSPSPSVASVSSASASAASSGSGVKTVARDDNDWGSMLENLNLSGPAKHLARHCELLNVGESEVELLLDQKQAPMLNQRFQDRLQEAFTAYFQREMRVTVRVSDDEASQSIATKVATHQQEKIEAATDSFHQDEKVKALQEAFGAKILPNSVVAGE